MLKLHFQTGNFAYLNFQPCVYIYIYIILETEQDLRYWYSMKKKQTFRPFFVGKHGGDGNEKVGLTRSSDVGCDSFGK